MYEIVDYDKRYMPRDKSRHPLVHADYCKMPVNPKGDGIKTLLNYKRGLEVFGVWCLLLQKTTAQKKPENRGKLLNHKDEAAGPTEIAMGISLERQVRLVTYALSVLVEMGWVKCVESAGKCGESASLSVVECSVVKCSEEKRKEEKRKKVENFVLPSTPEIQEYCKEKNWYVDAQDFIDFYASKDWMVGKNKMTDWRRALSRARKWECNKDKQPKPLKAPEQDKQGLDKRKAQIRKEDGPYFREQSIEQLRELRKTMVHRRWLIDEIIEEKQNGKR